MSENQKPAPHMEQYLKHALEFEKYTYIWNDALNAADNKLNEIQENISEISNSIAETDETLACFDDNIKEKRSELASNIEYWRKEIQKKKKIRLIIILSLFVGAGLLTILLPSAEAAFFFFGGAFSISMIISICADTNPQEKLEKCLEFEKELSDENISAQKAALIEAKNEFQALLTTANNEKSFVEKNKAEIIKQLDDAKENLTLIYAKNLLPNKYRNLNAVATLYEYLETRQCIIIEGHGGIYDKYENDLRLGIIIGTLFEIRNQLERIATNQRMLYDVIVDASKAVEDIRDSLNSIKRTNDKISDNTAIAATAAQQTASATEWQAWNTWAKGN